MEWVTTHFLRQWDSPSRNEAAEQLTARFTPLLVAYGRKYGLPHETAEDAAQDTMMAFVEALQAGKYDRDQGRLRDWIFGIAYHKIKSHLTHLARERRLVRTEATGFWNDIADEKAAKHTWNTEFRKMELAWCLEQARKNPRYEPKTFEVFELLIRSGMDTAAVAKELGMSSEAVRVAKHRVLSHIRELLKQLHEFI